MSVGTDLNLPLSGVCEAQSKYLMGTLIFTGITVRPLRPLGRLGALAPVLSP